MRDFARLQRLSRRSEGDGKTRDENAVYVGAEGGDFARGAFGSGTSGLVDRRARLPVTGRANW